MKVLITGATGFIGKCLVEENRFSYRYVVRRGAQHNFIDFITIDSIDSNTVWGESLIGVDAVIHLAGLAHKGDYKDQDYFDVNTEGTLRLASESVKAGVSRFIYISSIGVNGGSSHGKPIDEQTPCSPHNAYAESKYRAEVGLRKLSKESGLEVVIIRPTLVYGRNAPGNFGSLVRIISKLPALPFGCVKNKRSFVSVNNLSDFILLCVTHPMAANETFVISDDNDISTKEFINLVAKSLGKYLIQVPIPVSILSHCAKLLGKSNISDQLLADLYVDISKAKKLLNWVPKETIFQAMENLHN
tara:strand:+ start:2160 stop:3065 length:906 start_codon:yes stop_codon:yes gene_type:complete